MNDYAQTALVQLMILQSFEQAYTTVISLKKDNGES